MSWSVIAAALGPPARALQDSARAEVDWPAWGLVGALLGAIAIAWGVQVRSRRNAQRIAELEAERTRAEQASRRMQDELESRVAARTTELAAANESLRRERRLFVAGPVIVFRWVAAEAWPVEYVSPNVIELFGCSDQDFISGRVRYADVIHPDDLESVAGEVRKHSESGVPFFEQDYRIVRTDGQARWLYDFTVVVRDARGAITHYEGYVLDQTERKHAEEERRHFEARLQHAQKLESLGVLAGGIAHDFNNLLVGILGNADRVQGMLRPGSPERDGVQDIELASRRAAELTRQMLAYAGRAPAAMGPVELTQLVREMAHLLESAISKKARIDYQLEDGLPPVTGDPAQLRQVVMNLITNASDALGEESGTIRLATRQVQVDELVLKGLDLVGGLAPGRCVLFEVEDSGCGMHPATRVRMFEPFFTTKFAGRGLGLASVLGIVRAHNGGIAVESDIGHGTVVRVLLPVASDVPIVPDQEPVVRAVEGPLEPTTVLVVDDEQAVRTLTRKSLEALGLRVLLATDGEEGVAMFRANADAIGCVVLDLTMPRLNGIETLGRLREARGDVPVILTSGYNQVDVADRVRGRSVAGFLQKPFTPAELERVLREALAQ